MTSKQRLSVTVDAELLAEAERAVAENRAATLSAWVNDALRIKLQHDLRLSALSAFVAAYETEHGEITEDEMRLASRRALSRALSARAIEAPPRSRRGRSK